MAREILRQFGFGRLSRFSESTMPRVRIGYMNLLESAKQIWIATALPMIAQSAKHCLDVARGKQRKLSCQTVLLPYLEYANSTEIGTISSMAAATGAFREFSR